MAFINIRGELISTCHIRAIMKLTDGKGFNVYYNQNGKPFTRKFILASNKKVKPSVIVTNQEWKKLREALHKEYPDLIDIGKNISFRTKDILDICLSNSGISIQVRYFDGLVLTTEPFKSIATTTYFLHKFIASLMNMSKSENENGGM